MTLVRASASATDASRSEQHGTAVFVNSLYVNLSSEWIKK